MREVDEEVGQGTKSKVEENEMGQGETSTNCVRETRTSSERA